MNEQAQPLLYPVVSFGLNQSTDPKISTLFTNLKHLQPMDKNGPMSGRCGPQTAQMEQFLSDTFRFKNIPGEYIVQGVRSFELEQSIRSMDSNTTIRFPSNVDNSFDMTVQEIIDWQRSYQVYADESIEGMDKKFLYHALQGHSEDGEEAFRMKFVVRISTCPILMEFDAQIIPRRSDEDWPNRIKLVSVTGIDFAGRKHDVGDILYFISNWRAVFEIDPESSLPLVYGGRDFYPQRNRPRTKLREQRVRNSLIRMARLRLQACDTEGVEIVVETGIGLGVFSGNRIGIDGKIRALSAKAIRKVLQEDGSSYNNIRAVVFALPIFNKDKSKHHIPDTFDDFERKFRKPRYNGPIPVLIVDQDMHRLTVAIARYGFVVSELNPADSHGVFGEYWQNRGPAVEEKLALTTLGLLVQHHLINPEVINTDNYRLLTLNNTVPLNYRTTISNDDERSTCGCFSIR
jgi:hypothetical protein